MTVTNWTCICGGSNGDKSDHCRHCGRGKRYVPVRQTGGYVPREQAIRAAAAALIDAVAERASRTSREAAEAAWYPGHRLGSIEAIEAEILHRRQRQDIRQHAAA